MEPPLWPWAGGLTVGTQQALKLGQKPDGVKLAQEATVVQAVPQLDDKAADECCQLWTGTGRWCEERAFLSSPSPFVSTTKGHQQYVLSLREGWSLGIQGCPSSKTTVIRGSRKVVINNIGLWHLTKVGLDWAQPLT